jgi:hypothetical protein
MNMNTTTGASELTFDNIQMWNVDSLQDFCRKRDLKVTGRKAELVARVFAAAEMCIPLATSIQLKNV